MLYLMEQLNMNQLLNRNKEEKIFWQNYINNLPFSIRYWHKNITMKISTSFLRDF